MSLKTYYFKMPDQQPEPGNTDTSKKKEVINTSEFTADQLNSFLKEYRVNAGKLARKLKLEAYAILCVIISVAALGLFLFIKPPISATGVDILHGKTIDSLEKSTSQKDTGNEIIILPKPNNRVQSDTIIITQKKSYDRKSE